MRFWIFYFDSHITLPFVEKKDESGKTVKSLASHKNFAAEGDLIATAVDAATPEAAEAMADKSYRFHQVVPFYSIKTGKGIVFDDPAKSYRAKYFGFITLDPEHGLRLMPPFQINPDKTKAIYFVHPANSGHLPKMQDIGEILTNQQIMAVLSNEEIMAALAKIDPSREEITTLEVARSQQLPVHGYPEYYTLIIDTTKKAGKMLADGRIDYHERDTIIQITKDEPVLLRHAGVETHDGLDIFGQPVMGKTQEIDGFALGENLTPSQSDPDTYLSTIDGCLEINKKTVSVKPVLVIEGDIDFNVGNIDFKGSVVVKGYVHPGFSVKATGDITLEQDIEDAQLEAGGNIQVKMGITGKGDTVVKAGGTLEAKYIQNSKVEAVGVISIEDSIVNSHVFSNQKVLVKSQHGKILGGEVIALEEIEVQSAGSEAVSNTQLTVGKNLELEKEIETIRAELQHVHDESALALNKLNSTFGIEWKKDPKAYLAILPEFRKKIFLELLQEEIRLNGQFKELNSKIAAIEEKIVLTKEPAIIIHDQIYPGTALTIRKTRMIVQEVITNARFTETPGKTIQFLPN